MVRACPPGHRQNPPGSHSARCRGSHGRLPTNCTTRSVRFCFQDRVLSQGPSKRSRSPRVEFRGCSSGYRFQRALSGRATGARSLDARGIFRLRETVGKWISRLPQSARSVPESIIPALNSAVNEPASLMGGQVKNRPGCMFCTPDDDHSRNDYYLLYPTSGSTPDRLLHIQLREAWQPSARSLPGHRVCLRS